MTSEGYLELDLESFGAKYGNTSAVTLMPN